jgi:hypothetical protein
MEAGYYHTNAAHVMSQLHTVTLQENKQTETSMCTSKLAAAHHRSEISALLYVHPLLGNVLVNKFP